MPEVELVMNAVTDLEVPLDQVQDLVEFDRSISAEGPMSTQQLLDELLGRLEDDISPIFLVHGLTTEVFTDSDA